MGVWVWREKQREAIACPRRGKGAWSFGEGEQRVAFVACNSFDAVAGF
jgi:hypothetical protein